eukprot:1822122-Pyramimonas_sp.AAC.1
MRCIFVLLVLATTSALTTKWSKLDVGDQIPTQMVDRNYDVCHPSVETIALSDYDFTKNGGTRFLTVISHYYTGCNPGRSDQSTYKQLAYDNRNSDIAFLTTLKNGINPYICADWASLGPSPDSTYPKIVDDHDRALLYQFFDGADHPGYVVIDH